MTALIALLVLAGCDDDDANETGAPAVPPAAPRRPEREPELVGGKT